jgi:hypothetical protein
MHKSGSIRKRLIPIDIGSEIIYCMQSWRLAESWGWCTLAFPCWRYQQDPSLAGASAGLQDET